MATARKPKDTGSELGEFEGRPVGAIKIIVTKAGDGLSKAMDVEPTLLHQGDVGYLVLSYVTNKIRFDPTSKDPDDENVNRIQILEATGATFVDRDLIGDVVEVMQGRIADHAEELKIEREEAKGITRLHNVGDDATF